MSDTEPGSVIAHAYRVMRRIGRGAMGTVVEATVIATGERVAIKIPHDCFRVDGSAVKRFMGEARATMEIRSPHIVRTLAVGRQPSGMPFMVMEYIDGVPLSHRIYPEEETRMPLDEALSIADQIAAGLQAAHDAGLVHRDLKPGNVLVSGPRCAPVAQIFDFGLSCLAQQAADRLTLTGMTFGTPQYMAPEQIRSTKHVDARVDIYALGIIIYEMLTQTVPFDGKDSSEIWHKATEETPVALSLKRRGLPLGLSEVVMRAMARDADVRFASAVAFRGALAPLLTASKLGAP